ncbi:cytochrome biogenesis protein [Massilia sp. KIM]|uniref:sulfite exporter TauE/SafE family protein n=1 Tax=Massilia sp. KIM TaxID=1955422 RepID=UPI00098FDE9E|nr:sulfite exporter TauE/SafE family protein [Massilia sp. KIM]OON62414.1 cytochrome biogenesis protein [Massilia sp. KIM]
MSGIALFPVFLVGLLGSVHCAGMCGGIVGALSLAGPSPQPAYPGPAFPVPVRTVRAAPEALRVAAYNGGRIASYMAAGALAGGAAGALALRSLPALQAGAYWMANLMLVALGLFLMDAWRGLARLEQGGQALWRRLAPLRRRLGPPATPARMLAAGALWGWLPCGMVYSVLATAMLSGSALGGAAVMLAFGLGTLPMLAALGLAGQRLRTRLGERRVRIAAGLVVAAFGLLGLARAAGGLPGGWIEVLCLSPRGAA